MNHRNEIESDPDATTRIYARRSTGVERVEPAHSARTHAALPHPVRPKTDPTVPTRVREVRARQVRAATYHVPPAAWQPSPPPLDPFEPLPAPAPRHHSARSQWLLWPAAVACACTFVIVGYLAALVREQMAEDHGHGRLLPDLSPQNPPAQILREPVTESAAPAVEAQVDRRRTTPSQPTLPGWRRGLATERTDTRARHVPKPEVPSTQAETAMQRDPTTANLRETPTPSQSDATPASHPETPSASPADVTFVNQPETPAADYPQAPSAAHSEPKASEQTPVMRIVPLDADSPELDVPGAPLRENLSRQQVQGGIERMRKQLVACAGDRHGTSYAQLTINAEGRVTHSLIEGAFAGTPEGSCMARALRTASFPRFASETFTVRYPFRL